MLCLHAAGLGNTAGATQRQNGVVQFYSNIKCCAMVVIFAHALFEGIVYVVMICSTGVAGGVA